MGREIRKVPADWQHPRYTEHNAPPRLRGSAVGEFHPLFDQFYGDAADEWVSEFLLWCKGEHSSQKETHADGCKYYWEYAGAPPDPEFYRDRNWTPEEATHFVVYETVSEGTPVTPAFATKEELVEYLVAHGTFWDEKRGHGGWPRENAERFVSDEWAPSMIAGPTIGVKQVSDKGFYA